MTIAEIEKIKARASFLNSIASSSIVASVVTPAIGFSFGLIDPGSVNLILVPVASVLWAIVAYQLHLFALTQLGGLK
jgi:hypothetical protein